MKKIERFLKYLSLSKVDILVPLIGNLFFFFAIKTCFEKSREHDNLSFVT